MNSRPLACHASALPTELRPRIGRGIDESTIGANIVVIPPLRSSIRCACSASIVQSCFRCVPEPPIPSVKGPDMVSANQLIWWIDSSGILHSCAQISTPPSLQEGEPPHYAQGLINPVVRSGTITHILGEPAALTITPRELFDVLDQRFPMTRWWIPDHAVQNDPPAKVTVPAPL